MRTDTSCDICDLHLKKIALLQADIEHNEKIIDRLRKANDDDRKVMNHKLMVERKYSKQLREALKYVKGLLKSGETIYAMRIIDKALTAGKEE